MAGPDRIIINFGAETREVEVGGRKIGDVLSDTEKALEDVGATGEDSLRDVVDAQSEVADSAEDMGDAVEDAGERSGDSLNDLSDKTSGVSDTVSDLGNVAKDALEGDFSGAVEGGIGALTGLSAAIPGVGALVGTVFGEVGGAIIDSFQKSAEVSEKRVASMYDDMAESGKSYLSETFLQQAIQKSIEENYTRIAEVARLTGLTEAEVARAMATAGKERNAVLEAANTAYQEQLRLASQASDATSYGGSAASSAAAQYAAVVSEFAAYNEEQETAISKSDLFRAATAENLDGIIVSVKDLKDATESFHPIPLTVEKPDLDGVFGALQADADSRTIIFRARAERERVL